MPPSYLAGEVPPMPDLKPVYKLSRGRRVRAWRTWAEIHKGSREELRAWLWQTDPNGDYDDHPGEDPLTKRELAHLIVLTTAGTPDEIEPGARQLWPAWFVEAWKDAGGKSRGK